jgi:hypothetical protein
VPILIVTKRFFVNVDGCIIEHANEGIRLLATPQNKQTIKFTANELILPRSKQANNQTHLSGISSNTSLSLPMQTLKKKMIVYKKKKLTFHRAKSSACTISWNFFIFIKLNFCV